jgi:hypothetical protein
VPRVGQTVKYSRGVLEMEEKGARALFVRSSSVPETSLTQVDLFLLPGQSTEFDLMLWHCDQPPSGLFSALYEAESLPRSFDTFDEVNVECTEIPSQSRIRGHKELSIRSINLLRPWQVVVEDNDLKERMAAKEQVLLLSSLPSDQIECQSWVLGTRVVMRNNVEFTLMENHIEALHLGLAKDSEIWGRFFAIHRVPFHVLLISTANIGFCIEAIQWGIEKYIEEHGVQLHRIEYLYEQQRVLIPKNVYKVDLYALVCPNHFKTEEQLKQAVKDHKVECCVLFPRNIGDKEQEQKRKKTDENGK